MAKGSRGGKGGTGGNGSKTRVRLKTVPSNNGNKLQLEEPLEYTDKQQLSDPVRKQIDAWEAKRVKNKIEYATVIDVQGNSLGEFKGGKRSVGTPMHIKDRGETFSHIHPRTGNEEGQLGGTFSTADLRNFANSKVINYRAAAKEGTYFISKNTNFNGYDFKNFVAKMQSEERTKFTSINKNIIKAYNSGRIEYDEACRRIDSEFNKYLISMHNRLLKEQNKYGYTYGLEKRS